MRSSGTERVSEPWPGWAWVWTGLGRALRAEGAVWGRVGRKKERQRMEAPTSPCITVEAEQRRPAGEQPEDPGSSASHVPDPRAGPAVAPTIREGAGHLLPAALQLLRRGLRRLLRVPQVPHPRSVRALRLSPAGGQSPALSLPLCPRVAVNLNFLFTYWALHRATPEGARALQMALHTLRMMAHGGIHDHIGQVGGKPWG